MNDKGTVPKADVQLVLDVIRQRFRDGSPSTLVLALEGLKWLLDPSESIVTRASLEAERS